MSRKTHIRVPSAEGTLIYSEHTMKGDHPMSNLLDKTTVDDKAVDGASWVWRKVRLVLWVIGLLAVLAAIALAIGLYHLAT